MLWLERGGCEGREEGATLVAGVRSLSLLLVSKNCMLLLQSSSSSSSQQVVTEGDRESFEWALDDDDMTKEEAGGRGGTVEAACGLI